MKKQRLGHLCSGVVYRGQVCETLPPPPHPELAQSKNEMQGGVGGGKGKGQEVNVPKKKMMHKRSLWYAEEKKMMHVQRR